jgi:ATP-dependent RNA/DNA helicase IGHMBP2
MVVEIILFEQSLDNKSKIQEMQELHDLLKLLQIEKEADYEQFKTLIENKPLPKRKEEGFTWHPLVVTKSGYTYGERAYVIVERTADLDKPHRFRSGNAVSFFTLRTDVYRNAYPGVIQYINKNTMRITLSSKDLPDWLTSGQIGVDLLFDERTYIEMEKAVKKVMDAQGNRLAELRDVLLGTKHPEINLIPSVKIPQLNESQNQAVNQILEARHVAIVHGPPGTGKTTTLVAAIKQICLNGNGHYPLAERGETVLVTAPSNAATDLLTEKLAEQGLNVVRIGNLSRVEESIIRLTLDAQLAAHPETKNIKKLKIQAAECRRKARSFKRKFDHDAKSQRDMLKQEARDLETWANDLETKIIDQILDSAHVISSTLTGAASSILEKRKFHTVFIDEAAQALEPASWIPILRASKVVLAGDPFQLPPTVKSKEAQKGGFSITLIEKAIQRLPKVSLLNVQYRMNDLIMNFSNQYFYEGKLKSAPTVADRTIPAFRDEKSMVFFDTVGCGFTEKIHSENQSRFNPEEYYLIREHLYMLLEVFPFEKPSIGIISPYREQVVFIQDLVQEDANLQGHNISVNTIDGFQGQERDIIYISLVRSNEKSEIGFLSDYRRMNVALTRAKLKLVVIGDSQTIGQNRFYSSFLDYTEKYATYSSAWELMKQ